MSGVTFIELDLLKIFIAFSKKKWNTTNNYFVEGDFFELKKLLPKTNYRTVIDNRHLVDLIIEENRITFIPEEKIKTGKILSPIMDLKKIERIVNVVKEHTSKYIEQLLLCITLYSSIEICRYPKINKLEYRGDDEKQLLLHENNFQSQVATRISNFHKNFLVILEKKYDLDDLNTYLKPDIFVDYNESKLYIELKLGNQKNIINRYNNDIEKLLQYPLGIAICYDPKKFIMEDQKINFNHSRKKDYIRGSKRINEFTGTPIYFCLERKITKKLELDRNGRSSKKLEKEQINMAFCIYKEQEGNISLH